MVRDPAGKYPDTVFFDTDTAASEEQTIQRLTHRWSIEITNREAKSLLGSADAQCRVEASVTRAPLMAYWCYCFVVLWFVTQFRKGKNFLVTRVPWYSKRNITFSDMLATARRSHFTSGISRDPSSGLPSPKINSMRSTRDPYALKNANIIEAILLKKKQRRGPSS
jgi:hypothetical protein